MTLQTIKLDNLSTMIGQPRAMEQFGGITQAINTRPAPIRPILVSGPSGVGKDKSINLWLKDLEAAHWKTLHIRDCDSLQLQSNNDTQELIEALNYSDSAKICVVLNECQKIFRGSKNKSAMERDLSKFIFPHGESVQPLIVGEIAKQEVSAHFGNLLLVLATNEPEQLETSASRSRGEAPFARRFSQVQLGVYSQETIELIIPQVFAANGWKIGTEATGMVSRLHRGTMSAVSAVVEKLLGVVPVGKTTVNKGEVIAACRQTDFLPRGLYRREGRLLADCSRSILPGAVCQSIIGGGSSLFSASYLHLVNQFAKCPKSGEILHVPLIAKVGGGYITTEAGKRYLAAITKDGFTF